MAKIKPLRKGQHLLAVKKCARCGRNHAPLLFKPFTLPVYLATQPDLTHWAICPRTKQPLLTSRS